MPHFHAKLTITLSGIANRLSRDLYFLHECKAQYCTKDCVINLGNSLYCAKNWKYISYPGPIMPFLFLKHLVNSFRQGLTMLCTHKKFDVFVIINNSWCTLKPENKLTNVHINLDICSFDMSMNKLENE